MSDIYRELTDQELDQLITEAMKRESTTFGAFVDTLIEAGPAPIPSTANIWIDTYSARVLYLSHCFTEDGECLVDNWVTEYARYDEFVNDDEQDTLGHMISLDDFAIHAVIYPGEYVDLNRLRHDCGLTALDKTLDTALMRAYADKELAGTPAPALPPLPGGLQPPPIPGPSSPSYLDKSDELTRTWFNQSQNLAETWNKYESDI